MSSPAKPASGSCGCRIPPSAGAEPQVVSTGVLDESLMMASMLSELQPKPLPVVPGRSISVTCVPVSSWTRRKIRSPTHVCVAFRLTSRLRISPLLLTLAASVVPPTLPSGMDRLGARQISALVEKLLAADVAPVPQPLEAVTRQ